MLLFRGGDDIRKLKKYTPTKFMLPTSHYDKDEADFVVNFIQSLSHTKGDFFKEPFILIDWQEQLVRDIFGTPESAKLKIISCYKVHMNTKYFRVFC